jgi:hypothetical protein
MWERDEGCFARKADSSMKLLRSRKLIEVFLLFCLLDLIPRSGGPYFRYTGSDPEFKVWNLGSPLPLAIFDPRSGIHIGPFVDVIIPVQLLLIFSLAVIVLICEHRQATATAAEDPPA